MQNEHVHSCTLRMWCHYCMLYLAASQGVFVYFLHDLIYIPLTSCMHGYSCDPTYYTTHFRYGLQAAMNLRSLEMCFPCSRWSHMISLIRPMASVVFASSKNTTVSSLWRLFLIASFSAFSTNFVMSDSVIPPCTCTCVFVLAYKEITRLVQILWYLHAPVCVCT